MALSTPVEQKLLAAHGRDVANDLLTAINNAITLYTALSGVTSTASELNELDLSAVGAQVKIKKLSFTTTAGTDKVPTGFTFPAKAVLLDAFIDVTTNLADKTISVGNHAGDADEFLSGISAATTGIKIPSLVDAAETLGDSLFETVTDDNTDTFNARKPASVGGIAVSYKTDSAAAIAGSIYLRYIEIG